MSKQTTLIICIVVIAIIAIWGTASYNGLVASEEAVTAKWADVESEYQRRADLIPNLVSTVKGYATHESQTLENVVTARSRATEIKIDADDLTPEKLQEFQNAQNELSGALGRLIAISESYPELKANESFLDLHNQLERTENRIKIARNDFNEVARQYNTTIRRFPKNIFAAIFGFHKKPYFEAEAGASQAPQVEF